jgi:hypothetical protein
MPSNRKEFLYLFMTTCYHVRQSSAYVAIHQIIAQSPYMKETADDLFAKLRGFCTITCDLRRPEMQVM